MLWFYNYILTSSLSPGKSHLESECISTLFWSFFFEQQLVQYEQEIFAINIGEKRHVDDMICRVKKPIKLYKLKIKNLIK